MKNTDRYLKVHIFNFFKLLFILSILVGLGILRLLVLPPDPYEQLFMLPYIDVYLEHLVVSAFILILGSGAVIMLLYEN